MNEYDSQKLARLLERDYAAVDRPEDARLVIINTCSVRDKPEQKLYSLLGEMRELKESRPDLMVGVGGCVAQQEGEKIVKRSDVVDFVFGTHNLSLVPSLIDIRKGGGRPQVAVDYRDEWEELPLGFRAEDHRVSVFISISRGCNKNCTYCIVPTTRGREVSRALPEILKEVRIAAHRGVREVVLLGQTVNSYGLDFSPRRTFVELLEAVAAVEGIERIRFTSPHPQEIRQDFIDLVTRNQKVSHHVHMPLQSGSDRILKAMNRNYRREKYLGIIAALKERVPDMAITTDIIVGFPGETEEDFAQTLDVLERVRFDSSYSFVFSPRPGTVAATLPGQLPEEEKMRRLKIFQARQDEITTERLNAWVGQEVELLLDGPSYSHPDRLVGRSSQNITVNLTTAEPDLKPGMVIAARVVEVARYTLRAEWIRRSSAGMGGSDILRLGGRRGQD
jgi:tRNA-2-methylthio-N6-dimethylallyladenosine synthase